MVLSINELQDYINFLRSDMIQKGSKYGLSSNVTVSASQELDYFIFQYQILHKDSISV